MLLVLLWWLWGRSGVLCPVLGLAWAALARLGPALWLLLPRKVCVWRGLCWLKRVRGCIGLDRLPSMPLDDDDPPPDWLETYRQLGWWRDAFEKEARPDSSGGSGDQDADRIAEARMGDARQYCLKWNNHQNNLLRVFSRLLGQEQFTDCLLYTSPSPRDVEESGKAGCG